MSTITIHEVRLAPRVAVRRPVAASAVRLTRRGRVTVLLLGLAIALAVGVFLGAGSVATEHPGTPAPDSRGDGRLRRDLVGHRRRRGGRHRQRRRPVDGQPHHAPQRARHRHGDVRPADPGPRRVATSTDFVSRLDPGWRAGEDGGRDHEVPPFAASPRGGSTQFVVERGERQRARVETRRADAAYRSSQPPHELQPRPGRVDRGHLDVDEAELEAEVADLVLVEVGRPPCWPSSASRPRPCPAVEVRSNRTGSRFSSAAIDVCQVRVTSADRGRRRTTVAAGRSPRSRPAGWPSRKSTWSGLMPSFWGSGVPE